MEEVANPIAKAGFDRVEPAVEKMYRRLGFRLRQARRRAIARHGGSPPAYQRRNRLLDQAGDYAPFNFQPLPLRHPAQSRYSIEEERKSDKKGHCDIHTCLARWFTTHAPGILRVQRQVRRQTRKLRQPAFVPKQRLPQTARSRVSALKIRLNPVWGGGRTVSVASILPE